MADKGIIFSAPMVRALLEGRKTQTRRLIKPCPWPKDVEPPYIAPYPEGARAVWYDNADCSVRLAAPYAVGDRLYVREAYSVRAIYTDTVEVGYRAHDGAGYTKFVEQWPIESAVDEKGKRPNVTWPSYRPSIHMPRWASRLWLNVTDVMVQRLQAISEKDAVAEGCQGCLGPNPDFPDEWDPHPCEEFADLWNSLHTAPGETWADNPWIVAVTFEVNKGNIDR